MAMLDVDDFKLLEPIKCVLLGEGTTSLLNAMRADLTVSLIKTFKTFLLFILIY